MKAIHSSAALCLNFFRYWKNNDLAALVEFLADLIFHRHLEIRNSNLNFETKHFFGRSKDRQLKSPAAGNIDFEIRFNDSIILGESKFTEEFSRSNYQISDKNEKIYEKVFHDYFLFLGDIFKDREGQLYYQLAQRLVYAIENKNKNIEKLKNRKFFFLYYDYEGFNIQENFKKLIRSDYKDYYFYYSYKHLFNDFVKYLKQHNKNKQHNIWINYMPERYFYLI